MRLSNVVLSILAAIPAAFAGCVALHGCESFPTSSAITNFVFISKALNTSAPSSISWQAPAVGVSCKTTNATWINNLDHSYSVPCSPPENGYIYDVLRTSTDGTNATINFRAFAQCAASIYAFHYEADFPLDCTDYDSASIMCVPKGDIVASCTGQEWLPPVRPPPPPPCSSCGGWKGTEERNLQRL